MLTFKTQFVTIETIFRTGIAAVCPHQKCCGVTVVPRIAGRQSL